MEIILIIAVMFLFVMFFDLRRKQKEFFKNFSKNGNKLENFQGDKNKSEKFVVDQNNFQVRNELVVEQTIEQKKENKIKNEYNVGTKIFPAIGILSILIGLGFFLKDYLVLGDMGKVISGFILGIIFIAVGEKIRKKFLGYSTFLIGGGFSILYLSAKFGLVFDLYSNVAAFILMVIITVSAILISYKLESRVIAFVALIGGFISPVLASSGVANEIILFNYIIILLGGMLFLAWKKGWIELVIGSAIGTIILYGESMAQYYTNSEFGIYWAYLIIFFAIFTVAPFLMYFSKDNKFKFFNYGNLILPVVVGGIFISISYFMFEQMAKGEWENLFNYGSAVYPKRINAVEFFKDLYFVTGLIPAIFYLAFSKISLQKFSITGNKVPVYFFVSMTTFAIAMIPALQFSGAWITFAWFLEALVLALITFRTKIKLFLNIALPMLGIAIFRLFVSESFVKEKEYLKEMGEYVSTFTPILNERFLVFFGGISVIFIITYIALKNERKNLAKILGVVGSLTELSWIWMEINSMEYAGYISSDAASLTLSAVYLLYAVVLMYFGIIKKWFSFRIFAIVIFGFVILKTYFSDIWYLSEIWRILAFIILGFVILGVGYFYTKNKEKIKDFLVD